MMDKLNDIPQTEVQYKPTYALNAPWTIGPLEGCISLYYSRGDSSHTCHCHRFS